MSETPTSTLLIIDDEEDQLRLLAGLLADRVATIWTSSDPDEGLRLARHHRPALILLDKHMPGMSGTELLQQLRGMPGTAAIPVLLMTADNSLETVHAAAPHQVQGFLYKPFTPEQLLARIGPFLGITP